MTSPKKPKEKHVSAREAARMIERARQMLYEARCLLASSYRGRNAPPHVFEGIWRKAHEMREEHRDRIESTRGVVGHGLGYRFKNGRETKEPCVVVFVRRKVDPQELKQLHRRRIPEELRKGRFGVGTDVIKFVGVDIFHLRQTILATVDTIEGDSGAGLVDNSNLLLGILFGRASADFPSTLRVFSSASEVLKTLRCQI